MKQKWNSVIHIFKCRLCDKVMVYKRKLERPNFCPNKRCRLSTVDMDFEVTTRSILP